MQTAVNQSFDAPVTITRGRFRWPLIAVAALCTLMFAVEGVARFLVPRISKIESRTRGEMRALFAPPASQKPVVAVVGNSLLLAAIQWDTFAQSVGDTVEARRLVVEQTAFYDWYYGIKYLLESGMKPDTVVLMLSPGQLIGEEWRGEYSAALMMKPADVFQLARDTHRHPTDTANLVFASISSFYGLRAEIRKVVLGRLIPNITNLTWRLVTVPARYPEPEVIQRIAGERLPALDRLCRAHGVKFSFLVAPGAGDDGSRPLIRVGSAAGVKVISAAPNGMFSKADFPDGYHARPAAAVRYTQTAIDTFKHEFSR